LVRPLGILSLAPVSLCPGKDPVAPVGKVIYVPFLLHDNSLKKFLPIELYARHIKIEDSNLNHQASEYANAF